MNTTQKRNNLLHLALYVWNLPNTYENFEMGSYNCDWLDPSDLSPNFCGTGGCFAGHGPFAGILSIEGEDWDEYVDRVFTSNWDEAYSWLFSGNWEDIDNTPKGAAKRAFYFLRNGVPPEDYAWPEEKFVEVYQNESPEGLYFVDEA